MTLDEMDANLAEELMVRAERIRKFAASRSSHGVENPNSVNPTSFYCQNHHHADCRWAECKCVCHDGGIWGDQETGGYAC